MPIRMGERTVEAPGSPLHLTRTPANFGGTVPEIGEQVRLISVDDVCYFQANDKYTSVFTAESEALIRTPLKAYSAPCESVL